MTKFLYSVYDKATCIYSNPFVCLRDAEAVRAFRQILDEPNTVYSKYPDDFALYRLGDFSDVTGVIITTTQEPICQGTDLILYTEDEPS